jgi:hypothetical protein
MFSHLIRGIFQVLLRTMKESAHAPPDFRICSKTAHASQGKTGSARMLQKDNATALAKSAVILTVREYANDLARL